MMTTVFWEQIIRGQWFRRIERFHMSSLLSNRVVSRTLFLILGATAALASADTSVTELGQGIAAYNAKNYPAAITHLSQARTVAKLSDYVTFDLAYSQLLTGNVDGALATVNAYRAHPVEGSPFAGKISWLYARVLLDKRDPESTTKALATLQADYKQLPQPDGDFAMALAYEAQGEQPQAALSYERALYYWPNTDLAAQSATALERLRKALGKDFPAATPRQELDRAAKWLDAKEYGKARQEYTVLAETLTGAEKDEAKVGVGVADYQSGNTTAAFRYLADLRVGRSEADAQRLYYLTETARKAGDDTVMMQAVRDLEEHYPKSGWRLKALVTAGNRYLATNDREKYTPLFKSAADTFPNDNTTAYCHWKIAWDAYLSAKPDRAVLLREQVERYPGDSRAGTALYFLGRIAEADGKYPDARAYYERLSLQYPHYFYAVLARERTRDKVEAAMPDEDTVAWLAAVDWPVQRDLSATEANPATQQRIERARLLTAAGLPDVAESELRFGAKTENEQPQLLGLELAAAADSPFRALRIMKSFSGDYLSLPLEKASMKFWQALFPLPYKDDVFQSAHAHGLDPYYVAGLIRQESEFNPVAKSRASALGLMQLMPATGRLMGKKEGIGPVGTSLLFNPGVSIRLGTQYLRGQLDNWDGDWYRTLAAYNAGPGRVHQWLTWADFKEPVEFMESIPFTETREYIQAVIRNADIYRELYSGKHTLEPVLETKPKSPPPLNLAAVAKPAPAAAKTTVAKKAPVSAHKTTSKKAVAAKSVPAKKHHPA
jgi:soluble lytic murein transglycosylase